MRVLQIYPQLFDDKEGAIDGAERSVWELARAMSREAETTLLSFGSYPRELRSGESRVVVIGGRHSLLKAHGLAGDEHAYCHKLFSRFLYWAWQKQKPLMKQNLFPRRAPTVLAHLDESLPLEKPWDLAVLARRS